MLIAGKFSSDEETQRLVREIRKTRTLALKNVFECLPTNDRNDRDTTHLKLSQTIKYLLIRLIRAWKMFNLNDLTRVITLIWSTMSTFSYPYTLKNRTFESSHII